MGFGGGGGGVDALHAQGSVQVQSVERVWPVILSSLAAALGSVSFGVVLAYSSPAQAALMAAPINLTADEFSWFSSVATLAALGGALPSGKLADMLGRKAVLAAAQLPLLAGWLLISFASTFAELMVGRILSGLGMGVSSVIVPVYISEIAPPRLRGALGVITQIAITFGIFFVNVLGVLIDWRWIARAGAFVPGILFVAAFFLPGSPRWWMQKGNKAAAIATLARLRGPLYDSAFEMTQMESGMLSDSMNASTGCSSFFRRAVVRPLLTGVALMLFQQFCGINAVIFYSSSIFSTAGVENAGTSSLIVGAVQLGVTIVSSFLVDRAGRRVLLLIASAGLVASSAVMGGFFFLKDAQGVGNVGWLSIVSLCVFITAFSIGMGAVPWVIMGEIMPADVRGTASSLVVAVNWIGAFIVTLTFHNMSDAMTRYGVFWFFAGVSLLAFVFVAVLVPETKGRSLEEIQQIYGGHPDDLDHHERISLTSRP